MGASSSAVREAKAALRSNDAAVTELDLLNERLEPKDVAKIAIALTFNTTVKRLSLGVGYLSCVSLCISDKIDDDVGVAALGDALKTNNTLQLLCLRGTIDDAGAAALANALKSNTALTSLDVGSCSMSKSGTLALANAVTTNTTLTTLSFRSNYNVGVRGAAALADCLTANTALTSLDVGYCGIGDAGTVALVDAMAKNTTLTELDIDGTDVGPKGVAALLRLAAAATQRKVPTKFFLKPAVEEQYKMRLHVAKLERKVDELAAKLREVERGAAGQPLAATVRAPPEKLVIPADEPFCGDAPACPFGGAPASAASLPPLSRVPSADLVAEYKERCDTGDGGAGRPLAGHGTATIEATLRGKGYICIPRASIGRHKR